MALNTLQQGTGSAAPAAVVPSQAALRYLDIGVVLSIGLFPVLHVAALRVVLLLLLIGCILRAVRRGRVVTHMGFAHFAIIQFIAIFALNAVIFAPIEGTPDHFRMIAIESWALTAIGFFLLRYYLGDGRALAPIWITWLPVGLIGSFVIMSGYYIFEGNAGDNRIEAWAPSSLVPPTWYLALTLVSFAGYEHLGTSARRLRFALMAMSVVMAMYAGGRFAMIAWGLAVLFLGWYLIRLKPRDQQRRDWWAFGLSSAAIAAGLVVLDFLTAQTISTRFRETLTGFENPESMTFFRLEIWKVALDQIALHWPWGAGQINERTLISDNLIYHYWLRAHQTYLSYLLTGGIISLISGLIFQLAPLGLMGCRAMLPAFVGVFGVTALNGLTDSIFQSYVSVQIYIVLTMMLLAWAPIHRKSH